MTVIPSGRRMEQAAVNALRTLLHTVQVKGDVSWRRSYGYAVPVRRHSETWANGNVPVFCVVFDPETERLYWANATKQLRVGGQKGRRPRTIRLSGTIEGGTLS
ncbi:DUF4365 domain-containing protein [Streptomyces seoulensis]|uniref:DUF4365 domain-containing protein n=2 Tax=Streptomyces seoulensis TaxID=73044 RepID=A0A4P6TZ63_STRSO|nr:DUF4365 domain-containing protein [Streptomyces seoulensis]